jgi:hypothetical protein
MDPEGILYLSEKEYNLERRVAASNELTLEVLARPGTKRPTPEESKTSDDHQNSPHLFDRVVDRFTKRSLTGNVRELFPKFSEEGMVLLNRRNAADLVLR